MTKLEEDLHDLNFALDKIENLLNDLVLSIKNVRDNNCSASNLSYIIEDLSGISVGNFSLNVSKHTTLMENISILLKIYNKYGYLKENLPIKVQQK